MDQATGLRNIRKMNNSASPASPARVLTVTSGKGGVGKSSLSVNLAVHLRRMGKSVLIFDADFGLANVEVMFGAIPKYNLSDVIYKGMQITDIITRGPMAIDFISAGSGIAGLNNLTREQVVYLINCFAYLDTYADYIIIDTGAGISHTVLEFVISSPEVLLVVTPDPSSLTDSYSLIKALYKNPRFNSRDTQIRVVTNKVRSTADGQNTYDKIATVVDRFLAGRLSYLGMVPTDNAVDFAIRQQKPISIVNQNAISSKAFGIIANNLMTGNNESFIMRRGLKDMIFGFLNRQI